MIDHKVCWAGRNPAANLIIPTAFYVAEIQKVAEDQAFLKTSLWPHLQAFHKCENIDHFRDQYPNSECDPIFKMRKVSASHATSSSTDSEEGEWMARGLMDHEVQRSIRPVPYLCSH
jgi:hypothetical protein